jgi:hypothetical protein
MKIDNTELLTEQEKQRISTEVFPADYDLENQSDIDFLERIMKEKDESDSSENEVTFVRESHNNPAHGIKTGYAKKTRVSILEHLIQHLVAVTEPVMPEKEQPLGVIETLMPEKEQPLEVTDPVMTEKKQPLGVIETVMPEKEQPLGVIETVMPDKEQPLGDIEPVMPEKEQPVADSEPVMLEKEQPVAVIEPIMLAKDQSVTMIEPLTLEKTACSTPREAIKKGTQSHFPHYEPKKIVTEKQPTRSRYAEL